MSTHLKVGQLQIRTSQFQKAKLAEAARVRNTTVSQFVLNTSLEAADEVLATQSQISMSEAGLEEFYRLLDEEPVVLPRLKEQFEKLQRSR